MKSIPVLPVRQWVETWNLAQWKPDEGLGPPPKEFYVASMPIKELRALANVSRREIPERIKGTKNPGYQRPRDEQRSRKIGRYIDYGYPLSNQSGLDPKEHSDLVHPGWLPTTILINIIPAGQTRRRHGKDLPVEARYEIKITNESGAPQLLYPDPESVTNDPQMGIDHIEPIEVIDGQHRLYAADDSDNLDDSYEIPVVIFQGLSEQWQAYLFWVINVEPKKINTSLAFDLYPELRSSSWLERGETIKVYQEHRAQELTEILWRHPESPWRQRIELHGKRIEGHVSNAAFIRSLTNSFIRRWRDGGRIGGLFGSIDRDGKERVIRWSRLQQAAFLIYIWEKVHQCIRDGSAEWIKGCESDFRGLQAEKREALNLGPLHPAFAGPHSLLGSDQGSRAIMVVFNAILSVAYSDLDLESWDLGDISDDQPENVIATALNDLRKNQPIITSVLRAICECLFDGSFDWRTGSAPSIEDQALRQAQMAYKGSSGYTLLQRNSLQYLAEHGDEKIKEYVQAVVERTGN
jgi:hypothetical protein